ncbi:MAG: hypothetical protein FJY98_00115 [Candidatus Liptonbacteria bacterium]|nr:hypothetical protein [Candidatus Liptonbacteria bacterium]
MVILADIERELGFASKSGGMQQERYDYFDNKLKTLEAAGTNTAKVRQMLMKVKVGRTEKNAVSLAGEGSAVPDGGLSVACKPTSDNHQYYRTDRTFVIDPQTPNTMYVSVEHKGFYKTIDGGKTWALKVKGIPADRRKDNLAKPCYTEYPAATIDPNNSKHLVLALSGPPARFRDGYTKVGGIVESWDGAETWTPLVHDWMNIYTTDVAIDPNNSKTLYYTTTAEPGGYNEVARNTTFVTKGLVYKTKDSGKTWEELPTGFTFRTSATNIFIHPERSDDILVTTFKSALMSGNRNVESVSQMGILRSLDGGVTWKAVHSLPAEYEAVLWAAASRRNPSFVFVSPWGPNDKPPRSFYSLDRGDTFYPSNNYMHVAAYDPHDVSSRHMLGYRRLDYLAPTEAKTLFESNDAGATWKPFGTIPKEVLAQPSLLQELSAMVWHPKDKNTLFLTGAGGYIWKSTDGGASWHALVSFDKLPDP